MVINHIHSLIVYIVTQSVTGIPSIFYMLPISCSIPNKVLLCSYQGSWRVGVQDVIMVTRTEQICSQQGRQYFSMGDRDITYHRLFLWCKSAPTLNTSSTISIDPAACPYLQWPKPHVQHMAFTFLNYNCQIVFTLTLTVSSNLIKLIISPRTVWLWQNPT